MRLLTLPLAFVVSGSALAQIGGQVPPTRTQGFLTGTPVGVQHVKENAASPELARPKLRLRTNSVSSGSLVAFTTPAAAPGPENPDYSDASLFAWIGQYGLDPNDPSALPELGGVSTGGDITPQVDSEGGLEMDVATNTTWLHTTVTVDEHARGQAGSLIARPGAGSSDLYSYVAEGSIGIDPEFVDQVRVEYTTDQMDLPNANRGVNAIDWGMGLISRTPNGEPTQLQPVRNLFYFSVRKWWLDRYPQVVDMDACEIYVMEWDGTAWSAPAVAFSKMELFGPAAEKLRGTGAEIDALSVFMDTGAPALPHRVTFSMTPDSWADPMDRLGEILVTQRSPIPVQAKDLRTERPNPLVAASQNNRGTLITEKLGLDLDGPLEGDPDNVDGICNKDPKEPFRRDLNLAIPLEVPAGDPAATIGFTMFRDGEFSATGADGAALGELLIQAHGIDLQPWEIGAVTFQLEARREGGDGPFLTSSGTVLALPGADPPHVFGPITLDLGDLPPGTPVTFRGRVTMTVFDAATLTPLSDHESWWSELQLVR